MVGHMELKCNFVCFEFFLYKYNIICMYVAGDLKKQPEIPEFHLSVEGI